MKSFVSFSFLLIALASCTAFVIRPHQSDHLISIQTDREKSAGDFILAREKISSRKSFAIHMSERNLNTDQGVIIPEDGFGSPCVIKVRLYLLQYNNSLRRPSPSLFSSRCYHPSHVSYTSHRFLVLVVEEEMLSIV